jgi:hypothetical protein
MNKHRPTKEANKPIYLRQNNPETNRDATYLYFHPEKNGRYKDGGEIVPSMPRFATDGNPLEWNKNQRWWRAGGWIGDPADGRPDWKEIQHTRYHSPRSDWGTKWNTTEVHPSSTHYPKKRWNYVLELHEWQDSPFDHWKPSPVDHREQSVDHFGFARMWMDRRYKTVASLARSLKWKRTKVVERRNIVNRWLERVPQHNLKLPIKPMMTEHEEQQFLDQQAAIPPNEEQVADLLALLMPERTVAK